MYSSYIVDKLSYNAINFVYFTLGVVLGVGLILATYAILKKIKVKRDPLIKKYEYIPPQSDKHINAASSALDSLSEDKPIGEFLGKSLDILINTIGEVAYEYTGGLRAVSLELAANEKTTLKITIDTDFSLENVVFLIDDVVDMVEKTLLVVTDKYSVAIGMALKFFKLGSSVRKITIKDIVLLIDRQNQKTYKKLEKQQQKQLKSSKKEQEKEETNKKKKTRGKKNKALKQREEKAPKSIGERIKSLFKRKPKEIPDTLSVEQEQTKVYYKLVNKIIREVLKTILPDVVDSFRKLYGDGYSKDGGDEK